MHKPRAVLDSSVVVSAIGWRGEAWDGVAPAGGGRVQFFRTPF